MNLAKTLPENYTEICSVDLKENKKLSFGLNFIALIIMVAMFLPVHIFHIPTIETFNTSQGLTVYFLKWGGLMLAYILYIILHELTHGITMKYFGTEKVKYGFTGIYAYAGSDDYYAKKPYIIIALAPVVVWGIILTILCFLVPPSLFWIFYCVQIGNISGATGDFYVTYKFSKLPDDILVKDYGYGMKVYSAVK